MKYVESKCKQCGEVFEIADTHSWAVVYCSAACRQQAYRKRKAKANGKQYKTWDKSRQANAMYRGGEVISEREYKAKCRKAARQAKAEK